MYEYCTLMSKLYIGIHNDKTYQSFMYIQLTEKNSDILTTNMLIYNAHLVYI